jgi:hypothetical protein
MALVRLRTLPRFGVFRTLATGLRGVIVRWRKVRTGRRSTAEVILIGRGRVEVRAGLTVEVTDEDAVLNRQRVPRRLRDAFAGREPIAEPHARAYAMPLSWRGRGRGRSGRISVPVVDDPVTEAA